jgi:hypothetical protein
MGKPLFLLKAYLVFSGCAFFLVTLLHLARVVFQWPIVVGAISVPIWFSWLGLPASVALVGCSFWLVRHLPHPGIGDGPPEAPRSR